MKLYTLPNTCSHATEITTIEEVAAFKDPLPVGLTKESFRNWCNDARTASLFYSSCIPINPKTRVSASNPAVTMTGIIGDYDSPDAESCLADVASNASHLPMWACRTFSPGKVRLVWPFEVPLNITTPALAEKTLEILDGKIHYSKATKGYDKSSTKPNQIFHVGRQWSKVDGATPIPSSMLELCVIEAGIALSSKLNNGDVEIPIEAVAEEVERQFPGRWGKPFEVGQRGPLFWIEPFVDRVGCSISEHGMVCYSDRAPDFVPWRSILKSKFVDSYKAETIGAAASRFWFDGRSYYIKPETHWIALTREDAKLQLKAQGVSDQKRRGQNLSDAETILAHIQLRRRVDAAGPVIFRDGDIEIINERPILNLNTKFAMNPAPEGQGDPSQFPWIHSYIENAFDDGNHPKGTARDYFLAWFKHFYGSAYAKNLQPGQTLVLAGGVHTGKSFINRWLIGAAVGGSIDATPVLMKTSAFNKGAGEVGHWRIDDAPSDGDYREKRRFTQALKAHAANPEILWQPKFKDTISLPFQGRVCLTMNTDPESLSMLPAMDGSFADKVSLFLIRDDFRPKFKATYSENESMIIAELPHFLRWLLDWEVPESVIDRSKPRFGVKPFHHPKLIEEAHAESLEYSLQELLEPWCVAKSKDKEAKTTYTAAEILHELQNEMPGLTRGMTVKSLGKSLSKLIGSYPRVAEKYLSGGMAKYRFNFNSDVIGGSSTTEPV